ncbi:MAG: DMT family transporter [Acinetobacter sp.]|nr:DMT family transporter [Acinetobacter sp.]
MDQRKALDSKASLLMLGLCLILGLQQVILKIAAEDISAMMQIALRSGLAAILVYPMIKLPQGVGLLSKSHLKPGALVAFFFAVEFIMVAEALRYTSASHTVMLLYTAPIFTALGLHFKFPAERLSKIQWLGILVAFIGIMVTFIGRQESAGQDLSRVLYGDFLALFSGVFWALTTIVLRMSQLSEAHPTHILFYQLIGCFLIMFPLAFVMGQADIQWTWVTGASLIFHTLIVSFFSLLLWFWLLKNYLASRLGVFSFLTPIFGMGFGVWFLNEKIELNFFIGALMVMLGIIIVSIRGWMDSAKSS